MSLSYLSAVCSSAAVFTVCGTVMSVPFMLFGRLERLELQQDGLERAVARMSRSDRHGL